MPREDGQPQDAESEDTARIRKKIEELDGSSEIDEALKKEILDEYRAALDFSEKAEENRRQAAEFEKAISGAPEEVRKLQQELARLEGLEPRDPQSDFPAATAKELGAQVSALKSKLSGEKVQLDDLEELVKKLKSRPGDARKQLAAASQKLEEKKKELEAPPPPDQQVLMTEAWRTKLEMQRAALAAEIQMLEQEILSLDPRSEVTGLQRDVKASDVGQREAYLKGLEEFAARSQKEEAEKARLEAERALQEASDKHPVVRSLVEEFAALSQEMSDLVALTARTKEDKDVCENELSMVRNDFEDAREKLEIAGLSEVVGKLLLSQRDKLHDMVYFSRGAETREERIAEGRLKQLRIVDQLEALNEQKLEDAALTRMSDGLDAAVPPKVREEIRTELLDFLGKKKELLEQLADGYDEYLGILIEVDVNQNMLEQQTAEFAAFLDEHLLWIPSLMPFSLETAEGIPGSLAWLFDPTAWIETGRCFIDELLDNLVFSILYIIVVLALFLSSFRLKKGLDTAAGKVGRPSTDSILLTAQSLAISILLAARFPVLMICVSWILSSASDATDFARGVASALHASALLFLVLQFVRTLCRKDGVATRHFRWPDRARILLRRHLFWLMAVALPLEFVSTLSEWAAFEQHREGLGRISFVGAMVALSFFSLVVMKPFSGLPATVLAAKPDGWLSKLRYFWYPLIVAMPLSLAVLSTAGYDYTALRLENRLFATILLTFGIVLVYSLVLRWLMVAQGKLALAEAKKKHEALLAARTEESDEEPPPAQPDVGELDFAKINEQSRQLLRTLVGISVVLGLWFVWSDVLPALGVLEQVELWHHMVDSTEEGARLVAVTLADLLLAVVMLFLTLAAARNLPGVLEIAILKRLPLEEGSRYAIRAVSQYVITGLGIVVAFNVIGIGWEQVQFLVAALGVGLGFGLQEIFANFISGIIILFERPIRVGDFVTVGGVDGVVTRIRIRATTITDLDRKELIVPNKSFITTELVNWTLSDPVTRVKVPIGIGYGADTELAERLILKAARENSRVLKDPPPRTRMMGYGDSSVDYELRVFVNKWANIVPVKDELYTSVFKAFREHDIEIPFPQRDINFRNAIPSPPSADTAGDPRGNEPS